MPQVHHPTQFIHRSQCKRQHRKNRELRRTKAPCIPQLEAISRLQFKAVNAGLIASQLSRRVASSPPENRTTKSGKQNQPSCQGHTRTKRLSSSLGLEVKQLFSTSGRRRNFFLDIPLYRSGVSASLRRLFAGGVGVLRAMGI